MLFSVLLSFIVLGSSTAFSEYPQDSEFLLPLTPQTTTTNPQPQPPDDLVGLTVAALNSSYLIASSLLLYRRCTGGIIQRHNKSSTDTKRLVFGPWSIPGKYGIAVNAFACLYLTVLIFFCMWPPELPVTAANMNYTALVTVVVVGFSVAYYWFWARRVYTGPVVEVG